MEEKLGAEFEAGVLEVAEPRRAGLVPDLDRLEVDGRGGNCRAALAFQRPDGEIDLAEVGVGRDDKGPRLVLALRGDDADGLALKPPLIGTLLVAGWFVGCAMLLSTHFSTFHADCLSVAKD